MGLMMSDADVACIHWRLRPRTYRCLAPAAHTESSEKCLSTLPLSSSTKSHHHISGHMACLGRGRVSQEHQLADSQPASDRQQSTHMSVPAQRGQSARFSTITCDETDMTSEPWSSESLLAHLRSVVKTCAYCLAWAVRLTDL